jgi:hypothetical protein
MIATIEFVRPLTTTGDDLWSPISSGRWPLAVLPELALRLRAESHVDVQTFLQLHDCAVVKEQILY